MCTNGRLSGESGLTLIEIVIASAILMVIALMISTMLYNASTQQARIQNRANQSDLVQQTTLDLRLKPIPTASP